MGYLDGLITVGGRDEWIRRSHVTLRQGKKTRGHCSHRRPRVP